jgi:ABC-2 type transport system ATP-binding protein
MYSVETIDLSKTFLVKEKKKVPALCELNLAISPGEVVGFLGPNGAGKSTTIKLLTGQIRANSGHARIFGVSALLPQARSRVGYLPENPSFYGFMTAREYLLFVGKIYGLKGNQIQGALTRALEMLDLGQAADRPIKTFSKGMVQRLGLAQAIVHDPDLFIFDEPMSGLDPLGRSLVKELIRDLKKAGKTVFFSTHITNDVEAVCDRVAVLVQGRLMAFENVAHLLRSRTDGYIVEMYDEAGLLQEIPVSCQELPAKLDDLRRANIHIERINPRVRGLEEFFLDIVAKGNHDSEDQI